MGIFQIITDNLGTITGAILGITAVSAIVFKLTSVLKETQELIAVIIDAMKDNTLTYSEVKEIIDAADDIPTAIKAALNDSKID